jgi:16S rRNA (uracil1498-N3)-methyltransferase
MRIYIPPELINQGSGIILPPDKSRHLATVLRCNEGDEITVIDGKGRSYLARVSAILKKSVHVDILRELHTDTESSVYIVLCAAVLKGEKTDLVMQKATELGVKEIVPLITERCQVRETRKTGRWRKTAEEAAEQCGRAVIPVIHEPIAFEDFMKQAVPDRESGGLIFMEDGGLPPDEALDRTGCASRRILIFIGPEGGFSPSEAGMAEQAGFCRATLGPGILRADTAAIAAVALTRFLAERCFNAG